MAYVITEPCIGNKDGSCLDVCPVECIHPMPNEHGYDQAAQLYIDPSECIDCDACVSACPVDAPVADYALSDEMERFQVMNAQYFDQ